MNKIIQKSYGGMCDDVNIILNYQLLSIQILL
jgi:hypothetical protein